MPVVKLTNRNVKSLSEPGDYRDTELKGLMLRISASGEGTYRYEYRDGKGRGASRHIEKIGRRSEMPPEVARERARSVAERVRVGVTPIAERSAAASRRRVSEAWPDYVAYLLNADRSEKTIKDYEQQYRLRISPEFGQWHVSEITRVAVTRWFDGLARHKRSANYALSILSSFLSFCAERGYRDGLNPCKGVKRFREETRDASFSRDELTRFVNALREYGDPVLECAFWLLISTGARGKEVLGVEWSELDLPEEGEGGWSIPAGKMKQRQAHDYPLREDVTAKLRAYRKEIEAFSPRWVFPGRDGTRPRSELRHAFYRIEAMAGIEHQQGRAVHGFRHTFLTYYADTGASAHELMRWSGHKSIQTTSGYVGRSKSARVIRAGVELMDDIFIG